MYPKYVAIYMSGKWFVFESSSIDKEKLKTKLYSFLYGAATRKEARELLNKKLEKGIRL